MSKQEKIKTIKKFIKISVATGLSILLVLLILFAKPTKTFENYNMNKWSDLSEIQRMDTLQKIITEEIKNPDLLIACLDKISLLPESNNMIIQTAAALCYNGIKLNDMSGEQ